MKSLPLFFAAIGFTACDVKKVENGEMPKVHVEGEVKLPKYDVDAPDVKIEKKKVEVEVPTIKVIPAGQDTNDH